MLLSLYIPTRIAMARLCILTSISIPRRHASKPQHVTYNGNMSHTMVEYGVRKGVEYSRQVKE